MPFALGMVRRLAEAGHSVYASDAYELAPGSHSRYLERHFVTASPRGDTPAFVSDVERIASENGIDVVVPAFEEAFYLATRHRELSAVTTLFTERFEVLARLHDKSSFQQLGQRLGIRTPQTVLARSPEELREAIGRFPRYFARAAFSRGGVSLLTNTGPLAGHLSVDDVKPSEESPWLVQDFVDGPMLCTYSALHEGRVDLHCAYRAPRQWQHSTAIQFESVDGRPSLEVVERIGSELSYTGQMSLDFVETDEGLELIECNPRATDGVLLTSSDELAGGLLEAGDRTAMVAPGEVEQLDLAVFGQIFSEGLEEVPGSIRDLARIRGTDSGWHDHLPQLYSFLAFAHHERIGLREHKQMFVAMSEDICWDGQPIPGLTAEDAAVLEELTGAGGGGGPG